MQPNPPASITRSQKKPAPPRRISLSSSTTPPSLNVEELRATLLEQHTHWSRNRDALYQAGEFIRSSELTGEALLRLAPALAVHLRSPLSQLALTACSCVEDACRVSRQQVSKESFQLFTIEVVGPVCALTCSLVLKTTQEASVRCLRSLYFANPELDVNLVMVDSIGTARNPVARRQACNLVFALACGRDEHRDDALATAIVGFLLDTDPETRSTARKSLAALIQRRELAWVEQSMVSQLRSLEAAQVTLKQFALEFPVLGRTLNLDGPSVRLSVSSRSSYRPIEEEEEEEEDVDNSSVGSISDLKQQHEEEEENHELMEFHSFVTPTVLTRHSNIEEVESSPFGEMLLKAKFSKHLVFEDENNNDNQDDVLHEDVKEEGPQIVVGDDDNVMTENDHVTPEVDVNDVVVVPSTEMEVVVVPVECEELENKITAKVEKRSSTTKAVIKALLSGLVISTIAMNNSHSLVGSLILGTCDANHQFEGFHPVVPDFVAMGDDVVQNVAIVDVVVQEVITTETVGIGAVDDVVQDGMLTEIVEEQNVVVNDGAGVVVVVAQEVTIVVQDAGEVTKEEVLSEEEKLKRFILLVEDQMEDNGKSWRKFMASQAKEPVVEVVAEVESDATESEESLGNIAEEPLLDEFVSAQEGNIVEKPLSELLDELIPAAAAAVDSVQENTIAPQETDSELLIADSPSAMMSFILPLLLSLFGLVVLRPIFLFEGKHDNDKVVHEEGRFEAVEILPNGSPRRVIRSRRILKSDTIVSVEDFEGQSNVTVLTTPLRPKRGGVI